MKKNCWKKKISKNSSSFNPCIKITFVLLFCFWLMASLIYRVNNAANIHFVKEGRTLVYPNDGGGTLFNIFSRKKQWSTKSQFKRRISIVHTFKNISGLTLDSKLKFHLNSKEKCSIPFFHKFSDCFITLLRKLRFLNT